MSKACVAALVVVKRVGAVSTDVMGMDDRLNAGFAIVSGCCEVPENLKISDFGELPENSKVLVVGCAGSLLFEVN